MPTILAIDSAIGISSAAVWQGGKILAYLEDSASGMQAAKLVPLVEAALKQANLTYADLTHVAATVGPGSFTGIRIGLASARGIAFAAGVPCLGFTTLEVMHEAGGELCILNAGKGEVYYQYFGAENTEPAIGKFDEILARYPNATIASGIALPTEQGSARSGGVWGQDPIQKRVTHPRADALARIAANHPERAQPPSPFYIRPPDAKPQASKVS